MPSISLQRPERHTVLRSFAGHLGGDPDAAFRGLVEQLGDRTPAESLLVDEAARTAIVQGEWWYRGEYTVREDDEGVLVEYEIVNVAPTLHWAGPIAGRSAIRDAPRTFQALLTAIA
ncbi:hypothetical protein [Herbiconiux sp.]|uniref:hypothetical protein n=1 Tax=Herbiconiux sp. TaxID=1871186 RepID=UPI0025C2D5F4|nr:hypothetical protein [Herbiconiux sp.]